MTRKREAITLSLTLVEKAELERIALQFGQTWGERPNISGLLKAIAAGELLVYYNDDIPKAAIKQNEARAAIAKIKQGLDELANTL